MQPFKVTLGMHYQVQADDMEHAKAQAIAMHPHMHVISVVPLHPEAKPAREHPHDALKHDIKEDHKEDHKAPVMPQMGHPDDKK